MIGKHPISPSSNNLAIYLNVPSNATPHLYPSQESKSLTTCLNPFLAKDYQD